MDAIWSTSDFVYMCLRDRQRTEAFRAAIDEVVRPGDHVLEIGAGSGILSLFACSAGAARVTAVEIDPALAGHLTETARRNGFADRLTVLTGDGRDLDLPRADVVIAELIDTGLLDELQVPVLNALIGRGVVDGSTRVIPSGYRTAFQLVAVDETIYGYRITTLRHEWPFYRRDSGWADVSIRDVSAPVPVWSGEFNQGPHPTPVRRRLTFSAPVPAVVNGLRVSGTAVLSPSREIGACDTLNGDKIVPISERLVDGTVELDVRYEMGGGLGSLSAEWVDPPNAAV